MKQFLSLYGIATAIFVIIDMVWLTLVAKNFYKDKLGYILAEKASLLPAIAFYLLFMVGLVVFVIKPNLDASLMTVALKGALFGLVTYATYDLTNQATIKNWPVAITIVDLIWGAVISATICTLTVFMYSKF